MISQEYSHLTESVLSMPETERAELAALIMKSLDEHLPPTQRRSSEEWLKEIRRRSDALHRGECELIDAEEALERMRSAIDAVTGSS